MSETIFEEEIKAWTERKGYLLLDERILGSEGLAEELTMRELGETSDTELFAKAFGSITPTSLIGDQKVSDTTRQFLENLETAAEEAGKKVPESMGLSAELGYEPRIGIPALKRIVRTPTGCIEYTVSWDQHMGQTREDLERSFKDNRTLVEQLDVWHGNKVENWRDKRVDLDERKKNAYCKINVLLGTRASDEDKDMVYPSDTTIELDFDHEGLKDSPLRHIFSGMARGSPKPSFSINHGLPDDMSAVPRDRKAYAEILENISRVIDH